MSASDTLMAEWLAEQPEAAVLAIVSWVPDWLGAHPGELVLVVADPPAALPCRDYHVLRAEGTGDIIRALRRLAQAGRTRPFDLVYIKHDHRMSSLFAQVNGALPLCGSRTLFLFDDAVPPSIDMAGPQPPEDGWYVGEVWMLKHLLQPAGTGFFALTCDLPPTGLLAACQFLPLDPAATGAEYDTLSRIGTDAALSAISQHVTEDILRDRVLRLLDLAVDDHLLTIRPGDSSDTALRSRVIDPEAAWLKPPPHFVLDLSGKDLDYRRLLESERQRHGKFFDTFEDVHLLGPEGVLRDGRYYDHNRDAGGYALRRIAGEFGTFGNFSTGLRLWHGPAETARVVLPKARLAEAIAIEAPVLFGTPDEFANWGMWLFLGLPAIHEFHTNRDRYAKLLCHAGAPWQLALLDDLGIGSEDLLAHDIAQVYACREVTQLRHSWRDLVPTPDDLAVFAAVAQRLAGRASLPGHERIFVSRRSRSREPGAYRALLNEDALITALEPLGFTVIEPEFLRFADQIAAFRRARIVVGLGGAAMFNVVFCRPGTRIIDIESGTGFIDAHTNIFGALGLDYGVIFGAEDAADPRPDQKRWTLDVARAVAAIADFTD